MKRVLCVVILSLCLASVEPMLAQTQEASCPSVDQVGAGFWLSPTSVAERADGVWVVRWEQIPGPVSGWGYLIFRQTDGGWWAPVGASLKPYYLDGKVQPHRAPEYRVFAVRAA